MAEIPSFLLRHTVTVTKPATAGTFGSTPGAPVTIRAFVVEGAKEITDAGGKTVISGARFACRLTHRADCPVGALVQLPSGRSMKIVAVDNGDDGGLGAPQHLAVSLA